MIEGEASFVKMVSSRDLRKARLNKGEGGSFEDS